ncbi:hypothetical protein KM043_004263 [Ampulex compressa]|nr:hypothetical protein KM043_004263 [Ampulex compressa]
MFLLREDIITGAEERNRSSRWERAVQRVTCHSSSPKDAIEPTPDKDPGEVRHPCESESESEYFGLFRDASIGVVEEGKTASSCSREFRGATYESRMNQFDEIGRAFSRGFSEETSLVTLT